LAYPVPARRLPDQEGLCPEADPDSWRRPKRGLAAASRGRSRALDASNVGDGPAANCYPGHQSRDRVDPFGGPGI